MRAINLGRDSWQNTNKLIIDKIAKWKIHARSATEAET